MKKYTKDSGLLGCNGVSLCEWYGRFEGTLHEVSCDLSEAELKPESNKRRLIEL
jgi:hypothetical protein